MTIPGEALRRGTGTLRIACRESNFSSEEVGAYDCLNGNGGSPLLLGKGGCPHFLARDQVGDRADQDFR